MIAIKLLAVVEIGLSLMVTVKLFVVLQSAIITAALFTLVATIVMTVPEIETVAEFPVEQLLSQE